MTDFASDIPSTVIDPDAAPSPSGGGQVPVVEPVKDAPKEPPSLRSELERAFKEDDGAKPEPKPEKVEEPAKAEPKEADKPAEPKPKPEAKEEAAPKPDADKQADPQPEAKSDDKPDGAKFDPPKRFLPDSKEVWRNVPKAVRRDIETMVREQEETETRTREVTQRYESIRDFDELARSNGRELRDSLTRVHEIETLIQQNPVAGVNQILMEVGPRKADGQPVSLFELAQFIVQKGQDGYQQMVRTPQQQQQPQEDPRVSQLQQQLQEMKQQQLAATVIEPFKASHPRYDELQDDIALFLQSGKVPQSLSPRERLEAAYDMAVRINPPSREPAPDPADGPDRDRRADEDFSGSKSIKSSPGSVNEAVEDQASGGESIRDSILKAGRRLNKA